MDWEQNKWFAKHYSQEITPEFKIYWLNLHWLPDERASDEIPVLESEEYWRRCACTWIGWRDRQQYSITSRKKAIPPPSDGMFKRIMRRILLTIINKLGL